MTTVPVPSAALTVGRQGNYAGAVSRLAAFAADVGASWGLYTLGVALLNAAVKLVTGHSFTLTNHQLVAFIVLTLWEFLYFTYQWAVSGKTLGMAILGLQVVTTQGGPISGRQAVFRTVGLGIHLVPHAGHRVSRHCVPARAARPERLHRRDRRRLRLGCPGGPPALDRPQGRTQPAPRQGSGRYARPCRPRRARHGHRPRRRLGALRCRACPSPRSPGPTPSVAVVTLNRPERMNAMAFDVMIPFRDALREIGNDNAVRVVVITGAGRGFCSGADHENPGAMPNMDGLTLPTIALRSMELLDDVISTIRRLHQPVIAAVNGAAIGGGLLPRPGRRHQNRLGRGLLPGGGHQQRPDGRRTRTELPPAPVGGAVQGGRDHADRVATSTPSEADRIGLVSRVVSPGRAACRPASNWPTGSTAGAGRASS